MRRIKSFHKQGAGRGAKESYVLRPIVLRPSSVVLLLLPLLFAQAAYGSSLVKAAMAGDTAKVEQLLEEGADANAKGKYGWNALMWAAYYGHTETAKALIEAGADVNVKTRRLGGVGMTALMFAAWKGRTETVKALIEAGADVNAKKNDDSTALMWAAAEGHTGIVEALIDAGADVNAKHKDGDTALMFAASQGHTEVVEILKKEKEEADVAAPSVSAKEYMIDGFRNRESRPMTMVLLPPHAEFTPMQRALKQFGKEGLSARVKSIEAIAALLITERLGAKGYTVRALTAEELEKSPDLRELVRKVNDRYMEECSKLQKSKIEIGLSKLYKSSNALMRAKHGLYGVDGVRLEGDDTRRLCSALDVEGILLARIRVSLPGPLSYYGRFTEFLDVSVVNGKTGTVEAYFSGAKDGTYFRGGVPGTMMQDVSRRCFRSYPDATDVNAETEDGAAAQVFAGKEGHAETTKLLNSKLLEAAKSGFTATVEHLLKEGADANAKDNNGWTALMKAARNGYAETAKALLDAGADVNAKTERGTTALMFAAAGGHTEAVKILTEAGADVNAKTEKDTTASMYAASKGHTEIVEILKQAEARE